MAGPAAGRGGRVRPAGDPRVPVCTAAMRAHAEASLPHVVADHYMVTHWLAAYAVLLFS